MATATASKAPTKIRFECERYPSLKVQVASEQVGELTVNRYAEFQVGLLDLDVDDEVALDAVRRVALDNGIAEIGDPRAYVDVLAALRCKHPGCGAVSKNPQSARAHAELHARMQAEAAKTAAAAPSADQED